MTSNNGTFEYRRSVSDGPRNTESAQDGIPADDGMHALRQQLHQVRLLAVTTEEKARRMHDLMTAQYAKHFRQYSGQPCGRQHGRVVPGEVEAAAWDIMDDNPNANPYKLRPGDDQATISPLPTVRASNPDDALEADDDHEDLGPALGCMHYKRNVKVQCFDCERWFACRHCHDAASDLPFPHTLNRKKTRNMLCMLCKTPQLASERCINCGEYAAWYYCSKCKLWDNDSNKRIYHCDDCGLCRIGQGLGKDFVHCRRCNVCISIATSSSHPCIERATDSDCPLCLTYLFESPTPVVSLPCGHYMHGECYKDLMAVTYKCPVCNKSAVNMELQWRKLDDEISAQPMPEDDDDLRNLLPHLEGQLPATADAPSEPRRPRQVWIGCNDCGARSSTNFHWLGLKCQVCGGYNTSQMPPSAGRETEAERILRQQAQHRQHDFTGNYVLHDIGIGREDDEQQEHEHTSDRVDSAFGASSPPDSPTHLGIFTRRASEAHSPSRRYFIQTDEPRRSSSFTTSRFPTPALPILPTLANLPRMPDLPRIRDIHLPSLPQLPTIPSIELPRFSPYEMAAVLSRSLSPMRYARDEGASAEPAEQRRRSGLYWRNSAPAGGLNGEEASSGNSTSSKSGDDERDLAEAGTIDKLRHNSATHANGHVETSEDGSELRRTAREKRSRDREVV